MSSTCNSLVCATPSKKFPEGRTGTLAGARLHRLAGEEACLECVSVRREKSNEAADRYRSRHPERQREATRVYRSRQKDLVRRAKSTPCTDCKVEHPFYVMQFDHLDPAVKSFTIGSGCGLSTERLIEEIAKCEVVCANCHAERTYQRLQRRREVTTDDLD